MAVRSRFSFLLWFFFFFATLLCFTSFTLFSNRDKCYSSFIISNVFAFGFCLSRNCASVQVFSKILLQNRVSDDWFLLLHKYDLIRCHSARRTDIVVSESCQDSQVIFLVAQEHVADRTAIHCHSCCFKRLLYRADMYVFFSYPSGSYLFFQFFRSNKISWTRE